MTPIDADRFRAAYLAHAGQAWEGDVPATLEVLCDDLCDPDEWYAEARAATLAARAAIAPQTQTLLDDPLIGDLTIFPGDVVAKSHLTFNNHVFVFGDLDVDGLVTGDPAHAILMVTGNVSCRAMSLVRSYLFVQGSVTARDCFSCMAYGFNKVSGSIQTRLYLHDETANNLTIEAVCDEEGRDHNIEAEHIVCVDAPDSVAALQTVLVPELWNDGVDPFD